MKCKTYIILVVLFITLLSCGSDQNVANGPSIGITYGTVQMKMETFCIDVNSQYVEAIDENGAHVIKITVDDDSDEIDRKLAILDGILIPGGLDVHPSRYNEKEFHKLEAVDPELDALEFKVLKYARENKLPVLGICRGCQILNVFHGGSLYQDIPSQYKGKTSVQHREQLDLLVYTHSIACYHDIQLKKETRLYHMLGKDTLEVNTYHHQAVKDLAPGFAVNARSRDGLVEGIEHSGDLFILGTQFHPEKMRDDHPVFNKIFKEFIMAATVYRQVHAQ
ncbi:MAG: gamma-glutamyl-gamma-aminobutyrate hydrolase family protein [Spirochaetota bacterium]